LTYLVGFLRFWYDFLIGDDWAVAAGVVVALGLTALMARRELAEWVWLPVAVVLLLAVSLYRTTRDA
jgi:hypothetical protein